MIRTSNHTLKFSNTNKKIQVNLFIQEYKQVVDHYIDYLWNNQVNWKNKILDVQNDLLDCPSMLSTKCYPNKTLLSQRAIKCAATQACGIVQGVIEKRKRLLWFIQQVKTQNKSTTKLEEKLSKLKFTQPKTNDNFNCELNSICVSFKEGNHFNLFLQLFSIGKFFGKIRLPIQHHRQSNKWLKQGLRLNSILLSKNYVNLRWEVKTKEKKTGLIIGGDTGYKTALTLSDKQSTTKDNHGWDLEKIISRLSLRKKGSKNFKKTERHRKNYIGYSINQLNLNKIKQLNLEKIKNIRFGKSCSRKMSHWTYTLIEKKVKLLCEESGVRLNLQSSTYRSQRCSQCGLVRKNNRKNKVFTCSCGHVEDADYNASCNHAVILPDIPYDLRVSKFNRIGFYWLESGFYDLDNKVLTVPSPTKT